MMTLYERFEWVVALVLSVVIAVIIVTSLVQLIRVVFTLLVLDAFNPLDHQVFQTVFGMIMTLLIAMEFKHSIVRVVMGQDSIVQVKTVVLIALIALSRKFVILDPCQVPDDCIDPRRRALFIGRETMRELIEELRRQKS
ncbi:phosphate-starvation-inducible PsiE family protein [Tepidimonas aquatica]